MGLGNGNGGGPEWWRVTSVLIGRGAEQDRLRDLVREVAAGQGRSVLVEG
jgi:hypothetical protein